MKDQEKEELSFGRLSKAVSYWDWILPALTRLKPETPVIVKTLSFEDIVREEVEEETAGRITKAALEQWDTDKIYDENVRKMLSEQFGYRYTYTDSRAQKLKFTVSELKKRIHFLETMEDGEQEEMYGEVLYEEPEVVPLIPRFLQEESELSGASRGTAYHRILELLDFRKEYTEEILAEDIRIFQEEGKVSDEMAACISLQDIMGFLDCRSGRRMRECARRGKLKKSSPL